jgi:hypothetical protein
MRDQALQSIVGLTKVARACQIYGMSHPGFINAYTALSIAHDLEF